MIGARLDPAERSSIEADVEREIADAIEFAEKSPFPDAKELCTHVFAG